MLGAMRSVNRCKVKLGELARMHDEKSNDIQKLDQQITEVLGEIDKRDAQLSTLRDGIELLQTDLRALARERLALHDGIEKRTAALGAVRVALQALEASAGALRAEIAAPLHAKLTSAESAEISRLHTELSRLQRELADAVAARADAARVTTELEARLSSNLMRRDAELAAAGDALALNDARLVLAQRVRERKFAAEAVERVEKRCEGVR
jgi:structural maintenance of chromosome 3 (chondroitin sulfate proteoglycan 6)